MGYKEQFIDYKSMTAAEIKQHEHKIIRIKAN